MGRRLFLGIAVLVTVLVYFIEHSNIGWALVAIREDEDAAEIVGVRTAEVKWAANALACFVAGLVGGLYAQRIAYIEPIGTFAFDISLNVVLMAVIGGPGTWQGPLIGAPLVLLVADALRVTFTSEVNRVIFPGGIMGWLARWRRWRNLAELQGIISLPKMPISVMPNRTLTSPSHIRSSFSRFAQHLSADQQPFAPTIWPD